VPEARVAQLIQTLHSNLIWEPKPTIAYTDQDLDTSYVLVSTGCAAEDHGCDFTCGLTDCL
jgi:hypothetical protein